MKQQKQIQKYLRYKQNKRLRTLHQVFLAVQDSSINDPVTHSLTDVLSISTSSEQYRRFSSSVFRAIADILESRDLERFHSAEKSGVPNPQYRVWLILFFYFFSQFFVFFRQKRRFLR